MSARRTHTLQIVVVVAGLLLFVPLLLVWSGALGDAAALEDWAEGALFRVGLGNGSRLVIHDERGKLEVQIVDDELARVLLDGEPVPAERLRRDGDQLTVTAADGTEWGTLSLGLTTDEHLGSGAELREMHARVDAQMQEINARVRDDVAAHMASALAALDPPLPASVHEQLDQSALRAAAACVKELDRTVTTDDPDEAGLSTCRVKLDRDDLLHAFTDAFEDTLATSGKPLAPSDAARARTALSRAVYKLPELEYRIGP